MSLRHRLTRLEEETGATADRCSLCDVPLRPGAVTRYVNVFEDAPEPCAVCKDVGITWRPMTLADSVTAIETREEADEG